MLELIETQRLILAKPEFKDIAELFKLCALPEVNQFNPHGPDKDEDETYERLKYWIDWDWLCQGIGNYCVRLKDGTFIGYLGAALRVHKGNLVLNLSYRIHPDYQQQGYAFEGLQAILAEARKTLPYTPIRALTSQGNNASIALVEKLGLKHDPELDNYPLQGDIQYFLQPPISTK